jgi:hypothetical protein
MTTRYVAIVLTSLLSFQVKADLFPPNPFVKKTMFYPEILSIANNVSARPATGKYPLVISVTNGNWKLDYGAFKLTIDCTTGQAVAFEYSLLQQTDNGKKNLPPSTIYREPRLDGKCFQRSALPISGKHKRAYLFNPQLFKENTDYIYLANTVTNTIPIAKSNFSWGEAEEIIRNSQLNGSVDVRGAIIWPEASDEVNPGYLQSPTRIIIEITYSANSQNRNGKITLNLNL